MDRKELKAQAREAMRQTRPSAVWVTLMVLGVLLVTEVLSLSLSGELSDLRTVVTAVMAGQPVPNLPARELEIVPWLLVMALTFMNTAISVGYTLYCLRVSRRQSPGFGDVFDIFGMFFRAVWISCLRSAVMSLVSFLYAMPATLLGTVMDPALAMLVCLPLLAPLLVVAYAYRFAEMLVIDYPGYRCIQCMGLSRLATRGRRWELFRLDLSFLGWLILSLVPFVYLWVMPYRAVAVAGYYDRVMPGFLEELKNRPRPQSVSRSPGEMGWRVPGETPPAPEEEEEDPPKDGEDPD